MKHLHLLVSDTRILASSAALAILDTNTNGISDLWERQHNNDELFPGTFDPQADPDKDGWTNAEEAAAGTDPFDPNPPDGIVQPVTTHTPAVFGEPDGEGNPIIITPEVVTVSWPTLAGKQYHLTASPDLTEDSWLPVEDPFIATGSIVHYHSQTDSAERLFWRVAVTDVDTDSDGLTDAEEAELDTNAHNPDTDGDGLGDLEEAEGDTEPTLEDTDNDGLNDGEDADPDEPLVNWTRAPEARYILIDIESPPALGPDDLNDDGDVLIAGGISSGGVWTPLPEVDEQGTVELPGSQYNPYTYDTEHYRWTHLANDGTAAGLSLMSLGGAPGDYEELPHTLVRRPGSSFETTISADPGWVDGSSFRTLKPLGIDGQSRIFALKSNFVPDGGTPVASLVILDPYLATVASLEFDPESDIREAAVSRNGFLLALVDSDPWSIEGSWSLAAWDQGGETVDLADSNGYHGYLSANDLPNGGTALVAWSGNEPKVYLPGENSDMERATSLDSANIGVFAGDGTAMTRDNRLWRNGELLPLGDVCEAAKELIDDGWFLHPLKSNKHGVYLVGAAGPEGEQVAKLMVPVVVRDNDFATGVDDVSKEADKNDPGYQKDYWIMAPSGNVPAGLPGADQACKNDSLFHVPYHSASHLKINLTSSTITSLNPFPIAPANLDKDDVSTWPEVTWHGTALATTDDVIDWRLGTPPAPEAAWLEAEFPVKVKVMKNRKVKVAVYRVAEDRGAGLDPLPPDPDLVPTEDELRNHLNPLFAYQINTWFDVRLKEGVALANWGEDLDVLSANENRTPDQDTIIAACGGPDPEVHIHVFILGANAGLGEAGDRGTTHVASASCWISGGKFGGYQTKQDVLDTIGHEIGHVFFGIGHPDEPPHRPQGPAPLNGTNRKPRLMSKWADTNSKLIVKKEWDKAEEWLQTNVDEEQ